MSSYHQPSDMWAMYVGQQTPEQFVDAYGRATPEEAVEAYLDEIPGLFGLDAEEWTEDTRQQVRDDLLRYIEGCASC